MVYNLNNGLLSIWMFLDSVYSKMVRVYIYIQYVL